MNDDKMKTLIEKYYRLQLKYYSQILNLDSNSKKWHRAANALSSLRKTKTYLLVIEYEKNHPH